jgi:FSR family fosmidomycin resistance protein-like MFS transporter
VMAWFSPTLALLGVAMFCMGMFASIYHPAGVGLISHLTTPENRPMALGYHGILGSLGIAAGPLLAGVILMTGIPWRQYYLMLSLASILLAALLWLRLPRERPAAGGGEKDSPAAVPDGEDDAHWASYFLLISVVAMAGIVYASLMTFMPRYLDSAGMDLADFVQGALDWLGFEGFTPASIGVANVLTSGVLMLAMLSQFTSGRIARPHTLEPLMAFAFLGAVPFVMWMGFAKGSTRILAAALFTFVFFMHQPLFNSLVAKYTPRRKRSLCYGLSFTLGFGIGSMGPAISGQIHDERVNHAILAGLLALAGVLTLVLWWGRGRRGEP